MSPSLIASRISIISPGIQQGLDEKPQITNQMSNQINRHIYVIPIHFVTGSGEQRTNLTAMLIFKTTY